MPIDNTLTSLISGQLPRLAQLLDTRVLQELQERILGEIRQLPSRKATVLVVGAPTGRSEYMEWALCGDVQIGVKKYGWRSADITEVRVPNGLFCIPDDVGGASALSALIWMKLALHFQDVRVHSRLFPNPHAAYPLPSEIEQVFHQVFDRRETLLRELDRIKKILLDTYRPERIIVFGSLANDCGLHPGGPERPDAVHEWSDIDLAIVKVTPLRFVDRIREVMDLVKPRVGLNVVVFTPEELTRAEQEGYFFVRDEILKKGWVLFP